MVRTIKRQFSLKSSLKTKIMRNSEDVFQSLGGSFFRYGIDALDKRNKGAQLRFFLVSLALLTYVGVEIVKLVFRDNFGSKGISPIRVILSVIALFTIAGVSLIMTFGSKQDFEGINGNPAEFFVIFIFYLSMAIYISLKALRAYKHPNDKIHPNYRGDSTILTFLMNDGWSQAKVQNLAEPLLVMALGIFFSIVNVVWGFPLICCAISVWLHMILEYFMGISSVRDILAQKGYNQTRPGEFSEANY